MKFLEKIRKLPEGKRKMILWGIMIILFLIMIFSFGREVKESLKENKNNYFGDLNQFKEVEDQFEEAKNIFLNQINNLEK